MRKKAKAEPDQWKKATDDEYTAIVNNNTYRLVPLPKFRKSVTMKWIYKIKYNADSTVDCYKARWVARGFTQRKGIDYFKTMSPVVCMENLHHVNSFSHHVNSFSHLNYMAPQLELQRMKVYMDLVLD